MLASKIEKLGFHQLDFQIFLIFFWVHGHNDPVVNVPPSSDLNQKDLWCFTPWLLNHTNSRFGLHALIVVVQLQWSWQKWCIQNQTYQILRIHKYGKIQQPCTRYFAGWSSRFEYFHFWGASHQSCWLAWLPASTSWLPDWKHWTHRKFLGWPGFLFWDWSFYLTPTLKSICHMSFLSCMSVVYQMPAQCRNAEFSCMVISKVYPYKWKYSWVCQDQMQWYCFSLMWLCPRPLWQLWYW